MQRNRATGKVNQQALIRRQQNLWVITKITTHPGGDFFACSSARGFLQRKKPGRARKTRLRFPLHTFPSLRYAGVRTTKPAPSHKKKTPSVRMVFSFWNAAGRLELAASTGAERVKSRGKGFPQRSFLRCAKKYRQSCKRPSAPPRCSAWLGAMIANSRRG